MPSMEMHARHIQNYSDASSLEPHWGYADRVVPCTNDPGSCAYLDEVYGAHDRGMIYVGILWASFIAIVLSIAGVRQVGRSGPPSRVVAAIKVALRRYLLPAFPRFRWLWGHTSAVQVVVLAILVGYLSVLSFIGISYQTWITPVKNLPGVNNTRTSLGSWSDRVGVLAYALTPLSILLAQRESLLSVLTGIPYHHFNFLHRWIGHIILAQSVLHTIGWCIIEIRLYQPQPTVAVQWITQSYMIWGIVALILLLLLWGLSTPWARRMFGYEFFRKAHYVLAMLFVGACWAHWENLKCFMIPSLILWFMDRALGGLRTLLIHHPTRGQGFFAPIPAQVTYFPGDMMRLDLDCPPGGGAEWKIGQHFFLTFPDSPWGIWQSHPFTPLNLPSAKTQSYVFRGKKGETGRIAKRSEGECGVILSGPYGGDITRALESTSNVLCIAGGTGITFVLPVVLALAKSEWKGKIKLVWVVQHSEDLEWIRAELDGVRRGQGKMEVETFVTRQAISCPLEEGQGSDASTPGTEKDLPLTDGSALESGTPSEVSHRPDLPSIIREFVRGELVASTIYVSGPVGMISDVRSEVARCNDPSAAWRRRGGDVRLVYDERLE